MFNFFSKEDKQLYNMLGHLNMAEKEISLKDNSETEIYEVACPDDEYAFLHEAAIIEYHGTLFAAWYNCEEKELIGPTPIRQKRSKDGGKTWSDIETVAEDQTGKILFCPPVYGICEDKLYMLINEMVSADHIHALDLYVFQEEKDCFEFLWSKPIPFKLNTNVYKMANGKLLLPGRIAELDGFPNTPAVLISDSGKIDDDWRLVYIQENGDLPDGSKLVHPEITAIIEDNKIAMFSRDDERKVPLVYLSQDYGETWSDAFSYDIPFSDSKIYAGTLSDGRNYIIGNWYPGREKLVLVFSKPNPDTGVAYFKTGKVASTMSLIHPGVPTDSTNMTGIPCSTAIVNPAFGNTQTVGAVIQSIPVSCKNPEKVLEFVNLLYSDAEVYNALVWGIEGTHYQHVKGSEKWITYPDGVTGETSGYTLSATYAFGNRYLSYIWNTDPEDLNEKYEEFNDNAIKSKALGFVFDTTPVKAEAAAVQAVMDEYRLPLENGVIDPDENLPKFRQALKDAGIDTVIAEKQRQLDEWAATK